MSVARGIHAARGNECSTRRIIKLAVGSVAGDVITIAGPTSGNQNLAVVQNSRRMRGAGRVQTSRECKRARSRVVEFCCTDLVPVAIGASRDEHLATVQ